ncbi:hypothetical protein NPIL_267611 [Nephila pilipes]|uniref:Uncharacterized protein n=1 Tax=Nephila pilipes TaxID=299642 RepID=A0A8X6MQ27_NEPPI|nr:hypothetical protein NPIL_267611 [Nephila pilipes]
MQHSCCGDFLKLRRARSLYYFTGNSVVIYAEESTNAYGFEFDLFPGVSEHCVVLYYCDFGCSYAFLNIVFLTGLIIKNCFIAVLIKVYSIPEPNSEIRYNTYKSNLLGLCINKQNFH